MQRYFCERWEWPLSSAQRSTRNDSYFSIVLYIEPKLPGKSILPLPFLFKTCIRVHSYEIAWQWVGRRRYLNGKQKSACRISWMLKIRSPAQWWERDVHQVWCGTTSNRRYHIETINNLRIMLEHQVQRGPRPCSCEQFRLCGSLECRCNRSRSLSSWFCSVWSHVLFNVPETCVFPQWYFCFLPRQWTSNTTQLMFRLRLCECISWYGKKLSTSIFVAGLLQLPHCVLPRERRVKKDVYCEESAILFPWWLLLHFPVVIRYIRAYEAFFVRTFYSLRRFLIYFYVDIRTDYTIHSIDRTCFFQKKGNE